MINDMREEGYQVTELCAAFELSKSSYDAARKRPASKRAKENEVIVSKIKEIHEDRHLKVYGSPRMTTELQEEHGLSCSENRVARLMAKNGLQARLSPEDKHSRSHSEGLSKHAGKHRPSYRTRPSMCQ